MWVISSPLKCRGCTGSGWGEVNFFLGSLMMLWFGFLTDSTPVL